MEWLSEEKKGTFIHLLFMIKEINKNISNNYAYFLHPYVLSPLPTLLLILTKFLQGTQGSEGLRRWAKPQSRSLRARLAPKLLNILNWS